MSDDERLGMHRPITRRDFMDGVAMSAVASVLPSATLAQEAVNPPARTGLRGSHPGAFEAAHKLAFTGQGVEWPDRLADEPYDLVVVGAGISGLAAAYFYRQEAGPDARILVLDNHDDFGGHAKRNEFRHDGQLYVGYGGSQSLENPGQFSRTAKRLLKELGVDVRRFYDAFDQDLYPELGLGEGLYFSKARFGADQVVPFAAGSSLDWIDRSLLSAEGRRDVFRMLGGGPDPWSDRTVADKLSSLKTISYYDFLKDVLRVGPEALAIARGTPLEYWGFGAEFLSAYEALHTDYPGFAGLGLDDHVEKYWDSDNLDIEPYIFHFPDGNASLTRLLVRSLIPGTLAGSTMDDIVLAPCDYAALDAGGAISVRLHSTVLGVRHGGDPAASDAVDLVYLRDGAAERVQGRHVVLACNATMIPHLCPEMPEDQKDGLRYLVKHPLVYVTALVRNWQSFVKLGVRSVYIPDGFYSDLSLDFPVDLGGYSAQRDPSEPTLLFAVRVPWPLPVASDLRSQLRSGREGMLATPFATYERELRTMLDGMLSATGFDVARDVLSITVNRWAHGYSYGYNSMFDPDWAKNAAPHEIGRRPFGRIHIANADSQASAYADAAIDAGYRAVKEIVG